MTDVDSKKAYHGESFDEIEDEAKMLNPRGLPAANAQSLSKSLKVNEFDDLMNTEPWIERVLSQDRTTTPATSFEEECGRQTARHHKTTTCTHSPRTRQHTQTTSVHTRAVL